MTRRTVAWAVAATAAIAASACGGSSAKSVEVRYPSLRTAAAALSHHCTRDFTSSNSNGLLWQAGGRRPRVYYASPEGDPPDRVLTTRGHSLSPWGLLWPCDPPVVIHYPSTHTASRSSTALLTVLAAKRGERKTLELGQIRLANPENWNALSGYANGLITPNGRIVFFAGTKIRYANGPEFSVRGLPVGWQIGALVVSPRDPFVFLAVAEQGELGGQPCAAAVYRITRTSSSRLRSYDGCTTGVSLQWSPDGRHIAWFVSPGGNSPRLLVSDARGRAIRSLVARPVWSGVWSPDSKAIAYGVIGRRRGGGGHWTAVADVATGASRLIASGFPLAWSPDGKQIALIRQSTVVPHPPGSIVAVPAAGGRARLLLEVPAAPSG